MKSSGKSLSFKVYCVFCRSEPADKVVQLHNKRSYTVCDGCLRVMKVSIYVHERIRYDILVMVGETYVHLASTSQAHDPIFAYMVHVIREEVESAKNLLLSA